MNTLKRYITLVIMAVLASTIVSAKCGPGGIYPLSDSKVLNKNGLLILEFSAYAQQYVAGLGVKHPVFLSSGKEKIMLNVMEVLPGEMMVTQVVLKPVAELKEGAVYTLSIENLPNGDRGATQYNSVTNKWEAFSFSVNKIKDIDIPVLSNTPVEKKKTHVLYGCGPASWVYFSLAGMDQSELYVRTTVKNKTTGKSTTYILEVKDGLVQVGHGMCTGAFHFQNGNSFEITFQLLDQSGNKGNISDAIAFEKPTVFTNEE